MHAALIPAIMLFGPWVVIIAGLAYGRVERAITKKTP